MKGRIQFFGNFQGCRRSRLNQSRLCVADSVRPGHLKEPSNFCIFSSLTGLYQNRKVRDLNSFEDNDVEWRDDHAGV